MSGSPTSNDASSIPEQTSHASTTPKIRHDWYQTLTHVVVTVLAKGINKDDLQVEFSTRNLKMDGCQTRIYPSKIELKLKKLEGHHWAKLEGDGERDSAKPLPVSDAVATKPLYPSSNKNPRDWDKIVSDLKEEEKKEEPEGDEALNNLFQKIYADGSDETRKAMNKSFAESGGTVLSTNWKNIGAKKTDIKPPDGMEYRKWDQ